jgi:hypothetical protein
MSTKEVRAEAMSRTTPLTYYEQFVVPNYEDYLVRAGDIRLCLNACVTASQLADVVIAYCRAEDPARIASWNTPRALRIELRRRDPYFNTIHSAATAYKHLHAIGDHYQFATTGSLQSVSVRHFGRMDVTYPQRDVIVWIKNGALVSLNAALEAVVRKLWPPFL